MSALSIDPRVCGTCQQTRTQGDFISDSGKPMAQCCYCASKAASKGFFDEKHLGIMNRVGRMKALAAEVIATNPQGTAFALAELVQIFFRDDLKKLTEGK